MGVKGQILKTQKLVLRSTALYQHPLLCTNARRRDAAGGGVKVRSESQIGKSDGDGWSVVGDGDGQSVVGNDDGQFVVGDAVVRFGGLW
nr:hypothetical protein Itr_chr02CG13880 [Ipomoea trifida]